MRKIIMSVVVIALSTGAASAQSFKWLHTLDGGAEGSQVHSGLAISGSTLFGTAESGGAQFNKRGGTLFKINTDGTGFAVLHTFASESQNGTPAADGSGPYAAPIVVGNRLYGTTYSGGTSGYGTVFAANTDGSDYQILANLNYATGANPYASLIADGNVLYGTASSGFWGYYGGTPGTVFSMNSDGTSFTVLTNFEARTIYGFYPDGTLLLAGGVLYGTASSGGSNAQGTVFKVNIDGTGFSVLHTFGASGDGSSPEGGLVMVGGVLYGTTAGGGVGNLGGTVFKLNTDGTGYNILHYFASPDCSTPSGRLTVDGDNLFGTTLTGATGSAGSLFTIRTDGTGFQVLFNFPLSGDYAARPNDGLILRNDTFYGTAYGSGWGDKIFSLTFPQIQVPNVVLAAGTNFGFNVVGLPYHTVVVESRTNIAAGEWVPVQTNTPPSGKFYVEDSNWTNASARFYRVRVP